MPADTAPPAPAGAAWTCADCKKNLTTKGARMPRGWKRLVEDVFCQDCWRGRFILRAVTMPVAKPLDMEWKAFREMLQPLWAATTQASNWIMTELYARDARRLDQRKLPPAPRQYLYPELRSLFPTLPPQTVASIERAVTGKYMAKRKDIVWTCSSSLPTFRYPTPLPVHNQSWDVVIEDQAPVVSLRIGDGRHRVRLQSGVRFRRQMAAVAQIVSGSAVSGELAIYRQGKEIMCKMVAWLPRGGAPGERTGTLTVRTTAEALVVAFNLKDEKLWTYNGDQAKRWVAEHRKQLKRWGEDQKAEHRPVPPFAARRTHAAMKHRRRMADLTHTLAAMIVNYAVRRKFSTILFDDSDHTFVEQFPYFELAAKVAEKADAAGLEFVHTASAPVSQDSPEPLAN